MCLETKNGKNQAYQLEATQAGHEYTRVKYDH